MDLVNFRKPFDYKNDLDDLEKVFLDLGKFEKKFNELCCNQTFNIIYLDFDEYYKNEMIFPLVLDHRLSIYNVFFEYIKDPVRYTSKTKWLFTYENKKKYNFNNEVYNINQSSDVVSINEYSNIDWNDWKNKYESFFKIIWLMDEYLKNKKLNFPMGLRYIINRSKFLSKENKFVIHPGGTRQTIAKLFGGIFSFLLYDKKIISYLGKYAKNVKEIKKLDDLIDDKSIFDELNSTIIFYPKTCEYEFQFNAVNHINFKISEYAENWFSKIDKINKIQIKDASASQKNFVNSILNEVWNKDSSNPSTKIYNKIEFVKEFSENANVKLKFSKNRDTEIVILPYLLGTDTKKLETKDGFYYENVYGIINTEVFPTTLNTDCYFTEELINRVINKNKKNV